MIFWDLHNAHFLWLIHLFQLGEWEVARAYLDRAERIAKAFPEGADLVQMELTKGSIGLSHLLKGDWEVEVGLDWLRESLEAAERVGRLGGTSSLRGTSWSATFRERCRTSRRRSRLPRRRATSSGPARCSGRPRPRRDCIGPTRRSATSDGTKS